MRTIPLVSGRQPAPYAVRNGGFHIENGPQRYNRALYGAVKNSSRFSAFAGDVPEWMLYQSGGAGYVFLGVVKGKSSAPLPHSCNMICGMVVAGQSAA